MLENKKILLFISGSIAAYKSLFLIRAFIKEGALVRVIATREALKFITPLSIEALSQTKLLSDGLESWDTASHNTPTPNHIEYAKWADIAIFAPITANSINKLANGIADNIYLASALALPNIPRLLAPSANTRMLENAITKDNLSKLKVCGYEVIDSRSDLLACGEVGNGAMADISEIVFSVKRALYRSDFWSGRDVIITGGGSSENIDSVRCITNHSSGLQACNLALALYFLGAKVRLITSKQPIELPREIAVMRVSSSKEYLNAIEECVGSLACESSFEHTPCFQDNSTLEHTSCHSDLEHNSSLGHIPCNSSYSMGLTQSHSKEFAQSHSKHPSIYHTTSPSCHSNPSYCHSETSAEESHSHIETSAKQSHHPENPQNTPNPRNHKEAFLFMAAAISDYIPVAKEGKLKKKDIGEIWNLELHENIDILKSINADNLIKVAFKAECDKDNARQNAIHALTSKNCQAVCLNIISESNKAFLSENNKISCIAKSNLGFTEENFSGTKLEVSFGICNFLATLFQTNAKKIRH